MAASVSTWSGHTGFVHIPGADNDVQINEIPIVTSLDDPSILATAELDHQYATSPNESMTNNDGNSEDGHLRELLLSQLDLIQKQSEAIVNKDLQLRELKKENELLQSRLIKMEKRFKSAKETRDKSVSTVAQEKSVPSPEPSSSVLKESRKRLKSSDTDGPTAPKVLRQQTSGLLQPLSVSNDVRVSSPSTPINDILETSTPYYTWQGEAFVSTEQSHIASILAQAEVPGWRITNVPKLYSMEGTENIEDDTLLKRHQKLEVDEKRRKRWDIQLMREQRQVERLRARYDTGGEQSMRGNLSSLYNDVENLTHICVTDALPVSAFGFPLPKLPERTFSLPWIKEEEITGT